MRKNNTLRLMVVRHGESLANTKGIYQGQTFDTELSGLGKMQARALAKRLAELNIKKIISSPLKRTFQTALTVRRVTGLPVDVDSSIIETNHGKWEGRNKSWIMNNYATMYATWMTRPGSVSFPEGEAFQQTFARVRQFIENVKFVDGTLIVTHDNIVRIMAALAEGIGIDHIWKYDINPAAINFFEMRSNNGKNELKILKLNDRDHLKHLTADTSKHAL